MKHIFVNQLARSSGGNMLGREVNQFVDPESQFESKKGKRYRSAFTTGQINYLEKQFKKCPYIGNTTRKEVANVLNITERAIKIWFQNRRMKEKKEVANSEPNVDRQNNVINNLEYINNSLNNVYASQSANDRQYPLQSVMSYNKDNVNLNDIDNNSKLITFEAMKQETSGHRKMHAIKDIKKLDIDRTTIDGEANLFKYDINKGYNNMKLIKQLEKNNNEGINKSNSIPKIRNKNEGRSKQSGSTNGYRDLPEDLSANNNRIIAHSHMENLNSSTTYIPFCNSQNIFTPCVTAGNITWKPVNVMPVFPQNTLSVAVSDSQSSGILQSNVQKTKCTCDCHLQKTLNYDQPQYVIAIPYNT